MKEATAELNMTVVTVVAIAAVGAFFYLFVWPNIQKGIALNTCKNSYTCEDGTMSAKKNSTTKGYDCYCGTTNLTTEENANANENG